MKWSRARLRVAVQLGEIDYARKHAAEARLADAGARLEESEAAADVARDALALAEAAWSTHCNFGRFDPDFARAHAAELMSRDRKLVAREEERSKAHSQHQREQDRWREIEAMVRSGKDAVRNAAQALRKRNQEARDLELSDRTSWSWFSR